MCIITPQSIPVSALFSPALAEEADTCSRKDTVSSCVFEPGMAAFTDMLLLCKIFYCSFLHPLFLPGILDIHLAFSVRISTVLIL